MDYRIDVIPDTGVQQPKVPSNEASMRYYTRCETKALQALHELLLAVGEIAIMSFYNSREFDYIVTRMKRSDGSIHWVYHK
jgi:hypothetical protein